MALSNGSVCRGGETDLSDYQGAYADDCRWRLATGTSVLTWEEWIAARPVFEKIPMGQLRSVGRRPVNDPAESPSRWAPVGPSEKQRGFGRTRAGC